MLKIQEYLDAKSGARKYNVYLTKGDTLRLALSLSDAAKVPYTPQPSEQITFAIKMIGREKKPLYECTVDVNTMEIVVPASVTSDLKSR